MRSVSLYVALCRCMSLSLYVLCETCLKGLEFPWNSMEIRGNMLSNSFLPDPTMDDNLYTSLNSPMDLTVAGTRLSLTNQLFYSCGLFLDKRAKIKRCTLLVGFTILGLIVLIIVTLSTSSSGPVADFSWRSTTKFPVLNFSVTLILLNQVTQYFCSGI